MKKASLFTVLLAGQFAFSSPLEDIVNKLTSKINPSKASEAGAKMIESGRNSIAISDQQKVFADSMTDMCLMDDKTISQIENGLFNQIRWAIQNKDQAFLQKISFDNIKKFKKNVRPLREKGGIVEVAWDGKKAGSLVNRINEFSSIEYVDIKVLDYKINPNTRTKDNTMTEANALVRLDIRGRDTTQALMQDRFQLSVDLKKEEAWKISSSGLVQGLTLVQKRTPAFADVTKESGLDKVAVHLRTEAIRRGGYALSVIDYNNDGIQDLFVGHRENAEVFLGDKNGKFTKVKTPLDNEKYSKTAVFADFSNSGRQDAVINRFIQTDSNGNKLKNEILPLQVAFYKNTDKGYVEMPNLFGDPSSYKKPMPSAVADFNGDGLMDIYIGYPGVQDFSQFGEPEKTAERFQGLYINDGKGGFVDNSEKLNFDMVKYSSKLFPHSSLAVDINQDQKMDLVVLDDRGNLSPAFMNVGGGMFKESSEKIGITTYNYAMSITSGDLNNDGLVDLGLTSVNFTEMNRMNKACMRHAGRQMFNEDEGLRIYTAKKDKEVGVKFDKLDAKKYDDVGEAMGGLTYLDYNNDGLVDIYVVNGLWSGTAKGQEMGSFFSAAIKKSKNLAMYPLSSRNDLRFMDVLSGFKGEIADYSDLSSVKKSEERPSLAGYQRNRLLRNNGDGTFTDVAFLEGIDSMADGYIVGKVDYNKDGVVDLVLRNADPGSHDHEFPAVQLFKNNSQTADKSVILTFEGTKQAKDGIGLFVKAYAKKWQQVGHLEGNSGSMQQQRIVHFGLGNHKKLDYIEVYWPSGVKQKIKNIGPGYHHIVEPTDGVLIGAK